jgi:death-on-curing protein
LADAIEAHDTALLRGGRIGTISLASVESAIGRPYSGYYRSIHRKGAALIESICGNHGFTDGNKRTAVILLALLLDRSGYRLHPLESEDIDEAIANMTVSVADGRMSFDSIEMWLKNRVKKKPAR